MNIKKLDLKSMDIVEEKREQLKALFPEAFTEGQKIDFERLKLTLGEMVPGITGTPYLIHNLPSHLRA